MIIIPLFTLENDECIIEYLNTYKNISTVIFTDKDERLSDFVIKFKKIKDMFPYLKYGYHPFKVREEYIFDWIPIDLPDFIYSSELCIEEEVDIIYNNNISKEFKGQYYGNFSLKTGYEARDLFKQEKIARNIMNILVTDIINNDKNLDLDKLEKIKKIGKKDIYCELLRNFNELNNLKEYFDGFILNFMLVPPSLDILGLFFDKCSEF